MRVGWGEWIEGLFFYRQGAKGAKHAKELRGVMKCVPGAFLFANLVYFVAVNPLSRECCGIDRLRIPESLE